jgi:hypothetical protein
MILTLLFLKISLLIDILTLFSVILMSKYDIDRTNIHVAVVGLPLITSSSSSSSSLSLSVLPDTLIASSSHIAQLIYSNTAAPASAHHGQHVAAAAAAADHSHQTFTDLHTVSISRQLQVHQVNLVKRKLPSSSSDEFGFVHREHMRLQTIFFSSISTSASLFRSSTCATSIVDEADVHTLRRSIDDTPPQLESSNHNSPVVHSRPISEELIVDCYPSTRAVSVAAGACGL